MVPLQALYFLNATDVTEQAAAWAEQLTSAFTEDETRIKHAYLQLFSRQPTRSEIEQASVFLNAHPDPAHRWTDFCHTLFASNETIYLH